MEFISFPFSFSWDWNIMIYICMWIWMFSLFKYLVWCLLHMTAVLCSAINARAGLLVKDSNWVIHWHNSLHTISMFYNFVHCSCVFQFGRNMLSCGGHPVQGGGCSAPGLHHFSLHWCSMFVERLVHQECGACQNQHHHVLQEVG